MYMSSQQEKEKFAAYDVCYVAYRRVANGTKYVATHSWSEHFTKRFRIVEIRRRIAYKGRLVQIL